MHAAVPVAQLDRASASEAEGYRFDSCRGYSTSSRRTFSANANDGTVSEVTPTGTVSTFAVGFSAPIGLAFDAADNLYVANQSSGTVSKVPPPAGSVSLFASGFSAPIGLAFDAADNLYVANQSSVSLFASGFSEPGGLVFDTAGNLYVANFGNNKVSEVAPAGAVITYVSGFNQPGLAFDAFGNLYVSNDGDETVSKAAV